ncbi:MAG: SDR family NAD(P)-dependent oxidoreductase [Betaproteobacteria bacterium]|nr:SDR family NAD(P)-dependent oxidoreductase [Betaproteobacteria bacterium]
MTTGETVCRGTRIYQLNLEGKVALAIGGSRYLGQVIVKKLVRVGADLAIVSRKLDNCEAVTDEIRAQGRRALAIAVNAVRRKCWMPCSWRPTSTSVGSTS